MGKWRNESETGMYKVHNFGGSSEMWKLSQKWKRKLSRKLGPEKIRSKYSKELNH